MWWHGELWTIAAVESLASMGNHDFQPRHKRDQANGIIRYFKSSNELPSQKAAVAGTGPMRERPITHQAEIIRALGTSEQRVE